MHINLIIKASQLSTILCSFELYTESGTYVYFVYPELGHELYISIVVCTSI